MNEPRAELPHESLCLEEIRVGLSDNPRRALQQAATNLAMLVVHGRLSLAEVEYVLVDVASARGINRRIASHIIRARITAHYS